MALMPCPECGNEVSTAAAACPSCGHPLREPSGEPEYHTWRRQWTARSLAMLVIICALSLVAGIALQNVFVCIMASLGVVVGGAKLVTLPKA